MANEGERLAVVEALLGDIKGGQIRLEAKFDLITESYPTRREVNEMLKSRDDKIATLEDEIKELRNDRKSNKLQIPMWISVAVAVVMALYTMWPKK